MDLKMNQHFYTRTACAAILLFIITWFAVPWDSLASDEIGSAGSSPSLTPAPGIPLRKAVLDALRQEMKRLNGIEVLFVVRYLKVKNGWAWTHTQPQSPDGMNRYEDISALLNIQDGVWKVVDIPCMEVGNPDCLNGPDYFVDLKKRFLEIPTEILPIIPDEVKD